MAIINDFAKQDIKVDSILSLSSEAKNAKMQNKNVINATVGMLMDEDGNFLEYTAVNQASSKLKADEKYAYDVSSGSINYQHNVEKLIFGPFLAEICENFHIVTTATAGGSGAIYLTLKNYLEENNTVLLPTSMWEPYMQFAKIQKLNYQTYNLYNNDQFDVNSLKEKILNIKDDKVAIIINDPCHNPTGFSMSDIDYDNLIQTLNQINKKIILLLDISYIDYAKEKGNIARKNYPKLKNLNDNIITLFAFSASKTFGLYGLRLGALTLMTKDEEEKELFRKTTDYTARATWSSPSKYGISLINHISENEELNTIFSEELNYNIMLLNKRSNNFIKESKKLNLPISNYKAGFFIKVYSDNPEQLAKKLIEKNIYVVPLKDSIRIAISAINTEESLILPNVISQTIKELQSNE